MFPKPLLSFSETSPERPGRCPVPRRPHPGLPVPLLALALVFALPPGSMSSGQEGAAVTPSPGVTPSRNVTRDAFSGRTVTDKQMAQTMMALRQGNAPRVGERAPAFDLYSLSRERHVNLRTLLGGKPVVLIFASWGCDVFRESLGGLIGLHTEYQSDVDFVMIYTREVHALDGFGGDLGRVADPKSDLERREVARRCRQQLRLPFEILVDSIDDPTATRWAAMPTRLFVLDPQGTVIYAGAHGPWGYLPYRGYVHGDGSRSGWDLQFSEGSLEEFLEITFRRETTDPE